MTSCPTGLASPPNSLRYATLRDATHATSRVAGDGLQGPLVGIGSVLCCAVLSLSCAVLSLPGALLRQRRGDCCMYVLLALAMALRSS